MINDAKDIDTSHFYQIAKHIARVNGVWVFTGLLTVTNEKGEIRVCNLVASKSHDAFQQALNEMRHSLDLCGHNQPTVFYTDNIAGNKQFFEQTFPSLQQDVTPTEKYAHLEPFEILPYIVVQVKNTASVINDDAQKITDALSCEPTSTSQVIIGFDTEWNVEGSTYGGIVSRGATTVIQIAHKNVIYIFQVCKL